MTGQKCKIFSNNCTLCLILSLISSGCIFIAAIVCLYFDFEWNANERKVPLVINTWAFTNATAIGWDAVFFQNLSAIDAVELGCSVCEREQCDFTVGFGGSPDEDGETTLDAFIMDGMTMNVGAVGALRRVKSAVSVARHILEHTGHSILVGDLATKFAIQMGFKEESLTTNQSQNIWRKWVQSKCQPNYWTNVSPDPKQRCGPYSPRPSTMTAKGPYRQEGHDTISMISIDRMGQIAVGTSSNGANHKISGRVGDAPLVGAGGYADGKVGAAACTGDGDVMMRFLPSFLAVEEMRKGASPSLAAATAISRIKEYYPSFFGAIITVNLKGEYAAACNGMKVFPFSIHSPDVPEGMVELTPCI